MSGSDNRRRSFRLNDRIVVWVKPLDDEARDAIAQDFDQYRLNYSLKSHFINQREIRQPQLQVLRKRDKEVATYLEFLERQLIELAERLERSVEGDRERVRRLVDVNLSADGIRFITPAPLEEGQSVELGLDLPTNTTQIILLAKVMRVQKEDDGQMKVSFEYTHIHDEDIEAIIRHMARLQQQQLQARRAP